MQVGVWGGGQVGTERPRTRRRESSESGARWKRGGKEGVLTARLAPRHGPSPQPCCRVGVGDVSPVLGEGDSSQLTARLRLPSGPPGHPSSVWDEMCHLECHGGLGTLYLEHRPGRRTLGLSSLCALACLLFWCWGGAGIALHPGPRPGDASVSAPLGPFLVVWFWRGDLSFFAPHVWAGQCHLFPLRCPSRVAVFPPASLLGLRKSKTTCAWSRVT